MPMSLEALERELGIQEKMLINMRLLDKKIFTEQFELKPVEHANIQAMLESMIGNMRMNKQLSNFAQMSALETGVATQIIFSLKDISYRTRHLNKIQTDFEKIWKNFQTVQISGNVLVENEKITLKQYGILYDLANLNKIFDTYHKMGLITGNEQLEKLYLQTQRAVTMVSHWDDTFNQKFIMPIGSVVFDDTYKKSTIYGKELSHYDKLVASFVTKFGHASKGIAVKDELDAIENKISHINPFYQNEKYSLRNYLYSEVYQINIDNLINKNIKEILNEHLGPQWLNHVQQQFGEIERQIHDQNREQFMHIMAEGGSYRFAQIGIAPLQGGHKSSISKENFHSDIRDTILGKGKWKSEGKKTQIKLLCSEFIGQTIIASIQELNDVLKQELQIKGVQNIPAQIVKCPINEKEKLHLLTPERLLTAMKEEGALKQVEVPQQLSQFLAVGAGKKNQNLKKQLQQIKDEDSLVNDLSNSIPHKK